MSTENSAPRHVSVMPTEVLELLAPRPGEVFVDATVGAAGHTRMLAEAVGPTGRVVGLDQDSAMLSGARERLAGLAVSLFAANFEVLDEVLRRLELEHVDGVLADLGVCSDQLDDPERGLSFQQDGPLDMRLDAGPHGQTAAHLVARLGERELADIFFQFGEERHSRRVARKIVEVRKRQPIRTTAELADLVRSCVPRERRQGGPSPDPATRVFQALRIAVNDELGVLDRLLATLPRVVRPGGRVALISFHSLEDRRVKQALRGEAWEVLTRKPRTPGDEELARNPRSRSAKLRAARRV